MANPGDLLEVTPGLSQADAVNGVLIAILIERTRISFTMLLFVLERVVCQLWDINILCTPFYIWVSTSNISI